MKSGLDKREADEAIQEVFENDKSSSSTHYLAYQYNIERDRAQPIFMFTSFFRLRTHVDRNNFPHPVREVQCMFSILRPQEIGVAIPHVLGGCNRQVH
jgi:hypothetical protein